MRDIQIARILCPIDFSDGSRHALDHAMAIAHAYAARLTVFHAGSTGYDGVRPASPDGFRPSLAADNRGEALARMKAFVTTEIGGGALIDYALAAASDVHAAILAQADTLDADLLVMGTHGRSGITRVMLGSVTEVVLNKARCPVLTVPRDVRDAVPAGAGFYRDILCGVDFSECSLTALTYAISLAKRFGASLTVVHVVELIMPPPELANVPFYREGLLLEHEMEAAAKIQLAGAIPDAARASCRIEETIAVGRPHEELLRVAQARHAQVIVLGIRGRGGIDRALFGSTAQHLVRHATCPVLTLRVD